MKENSELLAQQARSANVQVGRPTIELVTPGAKMDGGPNICPPNCIPFCMPSCRPTIYPPLCDPTFRLPKPPPFPPRPN